MWYREESRAWDRGSSSEVSRSARGDGGREDAMRWPEPAGARRWWVQRIGLCLLLGFLTNGLLVVVIAVSAPSISRTSEAARFLGPSTHLEGVDVIRTSGPGIEERVLIVRGPPEPPDLSSSWPPARRAVGWPLTFPRAGEFDTRLGWGLLPRSVDPGLLEVDTPYLDRAYGWPNPAVWCELLRAPPGGTVMVSGVRGGLALSKTDGSVAVQDFRCLPYRPVWRGLAFNTSFYAAFWCFPFVVRPRLRGMRWIRLGRCGQCGYDLRGDVAGGCPECGWGRDGRA